MGLFGAGQTERGNQTYDPKPTSGRKAAKVAQRGGSAVSGTSSQPRAGRVAPVRGGSR
jgi:hypothetical protein